MPYVEGYDTWPFGEEWLFEAIATAYLPLLRLAEDWAEQDRENVLTLSVTPVLADQLALPDVAQRCLRFLREVRPETHRLDAAHYSERGEPELAASIERSAAEYRHAADLFEEREGDLLGALARLRGRGTLELWTSAATHAVLPLLATEQGARLQVATGVDSHRRRFGDWSGGFWLPECAYAAGAERVPAQAGARCFCVEQSAAIEPLDALEPILTPAGALACPLDWPTVELVWGARGYPAGGPYRDSFHRSPLDHRPLRNSGDAHDPVEAEAQAVADARSFVAAAIERLEGFRRERGRAGLLTVAMDAELLGHWWSEGPVWLGALVREAEAAGLALATLPEALDRHAPAERALAPSSWGYGKDLSSWDSAAVAELSWAQRSTELRLARDLGHGFPPAGPALDAARRASRELLALQSSDWAFLVSRETAGDYPLRRARGHAQAAGEALDALERAHGHLDSSAVPGTDPALRGLAPALGLAPLVEPPSATGTL